MKILFAKVFGIGNAVMSIPTIRALKLLGHQVDVLCGITPDDRGSREVFNKLKENYPKDLDEVLVFPVNEFLSENELFGNKPLWTFMFEKTYDLAILAIPYDGRWIEGVHFLASSTKDGRSRPDPSTFGFSSWQKHEVEYQLDNARDLGWIGDRPHADFLNVVKQQHVFIGIGYKRDAKGFWKVKHWGNENYANFLNRFMRIFTGNVVCTGNARDFVETINPIRNMLDFDLKTRFQALPWSLEESFNLAASAELYIGNDTGMMHVSCAHQVPTLGLFFMENAITKNGAWGSDCINIDAYNRELGVDEVLSKAKELLK